MAQDDTPRRLKPRIRKTAPTIRERAEAAQAEAEKPKNPGRVRPVLGKAKAPFKKIRAPRVNAPKPLKPVLSFIGKVLNKIAPRYFLNAWRELRQVTWPSRRETWRLTGAVFIFATVFGTVVYFVDKGLDEIFKKVILKS